MHFRWLASSIFVASLSCAGRSDTIVGAAATGGDGGTAATSGVSGKDSGAAEDADSGSSGGTGGEGGVNPGNAIGEKIANACSALSGTSCSVVECLSDMTHDRYEASLFQCSSELSALLDCTLEHPFVCKASPEGYVREPSPACANQAQAREACQPVCGTGGTDSTCGMTCTGKTTWAVECQEKGQLPHVSCVCTQGPNAGAATDVMGSCLGLDLRLLLEEVCAE